jgi:hypothetical protein
MTEDDLADQLDLLAMSALTEAFTLFGAIGKLPPEDRAGSGWGEWWAHRFASEIARRHNVRLISPEPMRVGLDVVAEDDLILYAVNLDRIARTNALGLERWCTDLVVLLHAESERRRADREAEKRSLADQLAQLRERRAREPYALPDDHGLPRWGESGDA